MSLPWSRSKPAPEAAPHGGYFALHDRFDDGYRDPGEVSDRFEDWDRRLGEAEPPPGKRTWFGRRKRWWIVRGTAAVIGLMILIVAWLAVTAPMSKSRQAQRLA